MSTAESLNMPKDHMSIVEARTSLHRYTQAKLIATFIEAGYKGFLTFMIIPSIPAEIELGARFASLAFTKLTTEESYEDQKEFSNQGGRIV